ncbi:PREDICTED: uncharacterized protein LOC106808423 [Priapulus caudatus]|uniref:Uncharacterized protein LOC106808423 n=1 Tax=Priapulus caudatus TaxID=37621 RepID=A0ABM1E357_PRICU|nr:PREDICTED: uncharacterized protein LOC106808423 [Priapulus caudatus]
MHMEPPGRVTMCTRCGSSHGRGDSCPAKDKRCRKCKKMGHFQAVCRTKQANEVTSRHANDSGTSESYDRLFIGSITQGRDDPWQVQLEIAGKSVDFKIDTGADITVMSARTYSGLHNRPVLKPTNTILSSPGGTLTCKGQFVMQTSHTGKMYSFPVVVLTGPQVNNLLGRQVASQMGLVKRVNEIDRTLFGDIGLLKCDPVKIQLKENSIQY